MRGLARFVLVASLVTLAGGPLLAAPLPLTSGTSLSAPAERAPASPWRTVAGLLGGLSAVGIVVRSDPASIAQKFVTRAGNAIGDYKTNVANAGATWEQNTVAAKANWEQGTQDAIQRGAFVRGSQGKSNKYQTNAVNLGGVRYAPGVQNAAGAYAAGIQPVIDKLKSIQLPPKGPRRSPQNQARAAMVATELGKLKTGK